MSKPYDATLKDLLETRPADWLRLLGRPSTGAVEVIDADLSTITADADKVFRILDATPWLMHLELQAGRDLQFPSRGLRYNVLLDYQHGLPVQSVIVLLRREADGPELTGVVQRKLPGGECYLEFRYLVVRVWQLPVDVLLAGGLGTLPLAPLTDEATAALPEVVTRIDERLRREAPPSEAAKLRIATFVLMGLRYSQELTEHLFRGLPAMEESSTYQLIVSRGKAMGKIEEIKAILLRLGRKRFGQPDPQSTAAIEAIGELDRLEQLTERILDVSSWQELLNGFS